MRIAFLSNPSSANGWYRSIGPMVALHARGHEIRQVRRPRDAFSPELVDGCDVLHIHREHGDHAVRLVKRAQAGGVAVVWDNDDDLGSAPRNSFAAREWSGARGARLFAGMRRILEAADLVTAPSAHLAEVYRSAGARRAEVIENYVRDEMALAPPHSRPDGAAVRVGWLAGKEHHVDVERIPIKAALERVLAEQGAVEVRSIGVGLGIADARYSHVRAVHFTELEHTLSELDIGIAPLADLPFNRARSNVKLKEYAAAGVPWLASDTGPYRGLGERQGGRLVADDEWDEAVTRMVLKGRHRRKLARRARDWGRTQTVGENVAEWERRLQSLLD